MNADELFYREFRDMINDRKAQLGGSEKFQIDNLPIPKEITSGGIPKTPMAYVKGINTPCFDKLNKSEVQLTNKTTLKKRLLNSDGTFRRGEDGKVKVTEVSVKQGFVAVLSDINIHLKKYQIENGVKRQISYPDGFRYVDYIETKVGRKYIYIIPKGNVYKMNMCALIMTKNPHRIYYRGCKTVLQNGENIYIYVVPFKRYSEMTEYRVLKVKSSLSFDAEVTAILRYWVKMGVIFDYYLTSLDTGVKGIKNLALSKFSGTLCIDEYNKYTVSMADEVDNGVMQEY